jgi:hypothetical protein
MVRQLDLPCWICGSRDAREVHHIHEWALWNKLDPEKVLDTLHVFDPYGLHPPLGRPADRLARRYPQPAGALRQPHDRWREIPGGHHRGVNIGVHDITFATWIAQRSRKDGETITHAINKAQGDRSQAGRHAPDQNQVIRHRAFWQQRARFQNACRWRAIRHPRPTRFYRAFPAASSCSAPAPPH